MLYVLWKQHMRSTKNGQEATLEIAKSSGHSAFEKEIIHLLISATNGLLT